MNKRQRRYIKREELKNKEWEKKKKDNKRSIIMIILIGIAGCIANFFIGQAISDGNMFFILSPLILRASIVAAFVIVAIMLLIKDKLR